MRLCARRDTPLDQTVLPTDAQSPLKLVPYEIVSGLDKTQLWGLIRSPRRPACRAALGSHTLEECTSLEEGENFGSFRASLFAFFASMSSQSHRFRTPG